MSYHLVLQSNTVILGLVMLVYNNPMLFYNLIVVVSIKNNTSLCAIILYCFITL